MILEKSICVYWLSLNFIVVNIIYIYIYIYIYMIHGFVLFVWINTKLNI